MNEQRKEDEQESAAVTAQFYFVQYEGHGNIPHRPR